MSDPGMEALTVAARLMQYPGETFVADLRTLAELSSELELNSTPALDAMVTHVGDRSVDELQEMFTQTFDMTPTCVLEVGWHMFGEDYARGAFLTRMRAALREYDIAEGSELPDHMSSMLLLVTRIDPRDAQTLVTDALQPAIEKILANLTQIESPFAPLISTIHDVLTAGSSALAEAHHA